MKDNSIAVWRTFMTLPKHSNDFGKLVINLMFAGRPQKAEYRTGFPFPVLPRGYSQRSEQIDLSFQCNYGAVASGTANGPDWYGGSLKYSRDNITTDFALAAWFKRTFKDPRSLTHPRTILDHLSRSKSVHVAHCLTISELVEAKHWQQANRYRCYHDVGAPRDGSEGCIINAYAIETASDEEITRIVSRAMRESRHCTDAQFAGWVANGSKWAVVHRWNGDCDHHPHTIEEIFGTPLEDAAAA